MTALHRLLCGWLHGHQWQFDCAGRVWRVRCLECGLTSRGIVTGTTAHVGETTR